MTVKFLGTSAGWPLPRLGCNCPICASKDPKDKRSRPALLVNDNLLIDAGPDIYHQLLPQLKNHHLTTILLTHGHYDHILGFWDLSHIYNREERIKVFAPQPVLNGVKKIFSFPFNNLSFIPTKAGERFDVDHVQITYFEVEHTRQPAFGIKIKEGKILCYIPDVVRLPKSSAKFCKDCHLLIVDGSSLGKKGQVFTHQSIEQGIKLAKELKAKQVYFTHLGHLTGTHDNLEKYVQTEGGKNFHTAFDNLVIEI